MESKGTGITRRDFALSALAFMAAPAIIGCSKRALPITGSFVDESASFGHRIRDKMKFYQPHQTQKVPTVIIGGGIAGLSAAWQLERKGFTDFILLEMEKEAGGNSRSGKNKISAFPWAAHYIPVPNSKSLAERELFSELGLLRSDGSWNEQYLCREPEERVFINGEWQVGIHPILGASNSDLEQNERFYALIDEMRDSGDFTIALEKGAKLADLDHVSMAEWMRRNDLVSPYLNWYVDYACRDDYGAKMADTSAWAGIHYFACREDIENRVFTWPEGNGWIVKKLAAKLAKFVKTGKMAWRVSRESKKVKVFTEDKIYLADDVIFAAPTFLAPHVVEGMPPLDQKAWQYSPWLVANLILENQPKQGKGAGLSWDNVIYDSRTLGYVVANHQTGFSKHDKLVWTFYWALADGAPAGNRARLLSQSWNYWKEEILKDLEKAHPDIRSCVSRIDIMRLGHAMIRPTVGSIFHEERRRLASQTGNMLFANSDLSGFSIFEEAQYYGVKAANKVLQRAGGRK